MKKANNKNLILLIFLLWTTACGPLTISFAAVPHLINYQGRLTDSSGSPLNGSYTITFRIYDAETAGNLFWQETQAVVIQKGIFSVLLGGVTNLDLAFDKPYFLEIVVAGEVMTPRQRITSAGYAIRAEKAENAEKIEGKQASDLIQVGSIAGGDLAGTYPNPTIGLGAITEAKIAPSSVSQTKLAPGAVLFYRAFSSGGSTTMPNPPAYQSIAQISVDNARYIMAIALGKFSDVRIDHGWSVHVLIDGVSETTLSVDTTVSGSPNWNNAQTVGNGIVTKVVSQGNHTIKIAAYRPSHTAGASDFNWRDVTLAVVAY